MEKEIKRTYHINKLKKATFKRMKIYKIVIYIVLAINGYAYGQQSTYVDNQGVFRWIKDKSEVRLFGINYTLPFAHGYRAINYLKKDHKEAIDKDVYHIARLGLDAFRIHVWDSEISDSIGNIISTKQLELLDYTLFKMKERGIRTIITPFKVGGNGYPEKKKYAPGFSNDLSKSDTYSGEQILEKQERYFTQFLNHINPYTGIAYKNDPDIIALEINNEPQHDNPEVATNYINRMLNVIRKTGFKNPIFYNVSERSEYVDAYCNTEIEGCTFQWYPTGLVNNKELNGNFLPNVDKYNIPFKDNPNFKNKARIIYEFDPGDTWQSYIYPAMARSFREAKFQFAAQFAYEPLDLAYANTEYQTHYLNLAYTPSKAISFMIASEVFHEMSNGQSYGRYPDNLLFGNTSLKPEKDLAIYNSKTKFLYTNNNQSEPKEIKSLEQIAGLGSSSLVYYEGKGAYFLDKLRKGVWRLEVMPDALWVNDPFEKASLKKTVAIVQWNEQLMNIKLPDLGNEFTIAPLNVDNKHSVISTDGGFKIRPGTYLISKTESNLESIKKGIGNLSINEFVAPKENIDKAYVVHSPVKMIEDGQDLIIQAEIVAPFKIKKVEVISSTGYQKVNKYPMNKTGTFSYSVRIPNSGITSDSFRYYIVINSTDDQRSFPSNVNGSPEDWDFVSKKQYITQVVPNDKFVPLFDANEIDANFIWPSQWNAPKYKVNNNTSKFTYDRSLKISIPDLKYNRPDMTFKIIIENQVKFWSDLVKKAKSLVIVGNSGVKQNQKVQIGLQLSNGSVFGKVIELNNSDNLTEINLQDLVRVPQVLLPRPFPVFQPYWFESKDHSEFDINKIEAIQISVGPNISEEEQGKLQELAIKKIYLK